MIRLSQVERQAPCEWTTPVHWPSRSSTRERAGPLSAKFKLDKNAIVEVWNDVLLIDWMARIVWAGQ